MRPLVSVAIPVFNGAGVLAETIESALAQTYPNLEVIVIDDGSRDATPEVMARYAERVIAIRQDNQGLAATRNRAMARARGKYVAWLDHDDLWLPQKISLQVALMERHPELVMVATEFSAFGAGGDIEPRHAATYYKAIAERGLRGIFPVETRLATRDIPELPAGTADLPAELPVYLGAIYERLVFGNCMHPPTLLMSREAAERAGPCDPRFLNDADYEFIIRMSRQGPLAFIDHPLLRYRYSEGQLSSDKNLPRIALSTLETLRVLVERDPTLLSNPGFKRRIAATHRDAAYALSESQRLEAVKHLLKSVVGGVLDGGTARALSKLLLPRRAVELYRGARRRATRASEVTRGS